MIHPKILGKTHGMPVVLSQGILEGHLLFVGEYLCPAIISLTAKYPAIHIFCLDNEYPIL